MELPDQVPGGQKRLSQGSTFSKAPSQMPGGQDSGSQKRLSQGSTFSKAPSQMPGGQDGGSQKRLSQGSTFSKAPSQMPGGQDGGSQKRLSQGSTFSKAPSQMPGGQDGGSQKRLSQESTFSKAPSQMPGGQDSGNQKRLSQGSTFSKAPSQMPGGQGGRSEKRLSQGSTFSKAPSQMPGGQEVGGEKRLSQGSTFSKAPSQMPGGQGGGSEKRLSQGSTFSKAPSQMPGGQGGGSEKRLSQGSTFSKAPSQMPGGQEVGGEKRLSQGSTFSKAPSQMPGGQDVGSEKRLSQGSTFSKEPSQMPDEDGEKRLSQDLEGIEFDRQSQKRSSKDSQAQRGSLTSGDLDRQQFMEPQDQENEMFANENLEGQETYGSGQGYGEMDRRDQGVQKWDGQDLGTSEWEEHVLNYGLDIPEWPGEDIRYGFVGEEIDGEGYGEKEMGQQQTEMEVKGESGEQTDGIDLSVFCCEQIQIPPLLPEILKKYTKGALVTQPRDLLQWTGAYFRALANGEVPPVKDKLEYPLPESKSGLSPGLLRVLHQQLKEKKYVSLRKMKEKWKGVCLDVKDLEALVRMAQLGEKFRWAKLLDLAAGTIGKNMSDTMRIVCEVMTDQPDGVDPYIHFETWWDHYVYLAQLAKIDGDQVQSVFEFMKRVATGNYNMVGPREFLHQDCPPLQ